jgi:3-hydroxyisobutyrate dehydrogenase-like beta-hydroxyacid dehydrogenase
VAAPAQRPIRRVGFIGLGAMGGALATRIIGAGFPTVLWARRPEVMASYDAPNVEVAASPAEMAAGVDLVGICVWDDDDVREVLAGDSGVLAGCGPGTVIAIHSTIRPATCRQLATAGAAREVAVLDAPVSGGRDVALAGSLVVAVGGDDAAFEQCRPVFASFGDPVVHVGPVGTGQFAKLVNNALLAANLALADDALALAESMGVEPEAMAEVLKHGSGRSFGLDVALRARRSPETRRAVREPLEKDMRNLTSEAGEDTALLAEAAMEALRRLAE